MRHPVICHSLSKLSDPAAKLTFGELAMLTETIEKTIPVVSEVEKGFSVYPLNCYDERTRVMLKEVPRYEDSADWMATRLKTALTFIHSEADGMTRRNAYEKLLGDGNDAQIIAFFLSPMAKLITKKRYKEPSFFQAIRDITDRENQGWDRISAAYRMHQKNHRCFYGEGLESIAPPVWPRELKI